MANRSHVEIGCSRPNAPGSCKGTKSMVKKSNKDDLGLEGTSAGTCLRIPGEQKSTFVNSFCHKMPDLQWAELEVVEMLYN